MQHNGMSPARRITLPALFIALGVAGMYFSSLLTSTSMAMGALLCMLPAVLAWEGQRWPAVATYLGTLTLGLILLPNRTVMIEYGLMFGWYGMAHVWLPFKVRGIWLWAVKLLLFNAALFAGMYLYTLLGIPLDMAWWLLALAAQVIFFLFDRLVGVTLMYYQRRLRRFFMGGIR